MRVMLLLMQADFASINVTSSSEAGAIVDIPFIRQGNNTIQ